MIAALKSARGTDAIRTAVREAVDRVIGKGQGNAANTQLTLRGLKDALGHTSDPKLRNEIRAAIAKVERKIPGREFALRQIAIANKALADGKLTVAESKRVKAAIQALKDRGLPAAAAAISARVDAAKRAQVAASLAAGRAAAAAIAAKDLSVVVNAAFKTVVSIRGIDSARVTQQGFSGKFVQ